MIKKLQHRFALSEIGARNLIKACISCTISYLTLAFSIGILYFFTDEVITTLYAEGLFKIHYVVYIVEMIFVAILIFVAHYIQYKMTFINTYNESSRLRISLAEHLRQIPLAFFAKRDVSDLTTTILGDVTYMEQALSHFIPEFVGSICSTTFMSIGLLFFDVKMGIAVIWCVPISFLLIFLARNQLQKGNQAYSDKILSRAHKIQEGLETMRDLKANHFKETYLKEVNQSIDEAEHLQIKNELTNAFFVVGAQLVLKLGLATTVVAGVSSLVDGQISLSVFLMFLIVASRLYDPLSSTLQNLAAIISCKSHIDRLNEINEQSLQTGQKIFKPENYDIEFKNVCFGYDSKKQVINDVSFVAKQGSITALIGQSGSGKSTCAKLAARFWDIEKGIITVGGQDISKIDPETLLSKYSIVFQDVVLFNSSILDNIRIGKKEASDKEVLEAAKLAYCDEFVREFKDGYNTVIGENGAKLSGGQRQRISIASALLKDAPIILLDEATASLDVESETYVQKALSHLIENKTVLIIAHRMRTIANADHLIVLEDGKIVEEGRPDQLIQTNSKYRQMMEIQSVSHSFVIH